MVEVLEIKGAAGFHYSDAPQKSPEWFAIRAPRLGASQLGGYMGKGAKGQYLAPRKVITREISFSKAFNVPFSKFVNDAMKAGIENEDYMADQYSSQMGVVLEKVGCFYNDWFVASPDRRIVGTNGLVEIKWLFDNSWSELIETGLPCEDHILQMQGQMWATGAEYVDYVAGNGNTGRFVVIRIFRDDVTIAEIELEGESVLAIEPMKTTNVFQFSENIKAPAQIDAGGWED